MSDRFKVPASWPVQDPKRYKPLDWFVPYERNARTHPTDQIALLAQLIAKHGPDQDIVVDENRIILKGHGRATAAKQAGLTHFTFTQRFGLSEAEKAAIRIQDNQVALLGGWDTKLIVGEISVLRTDGFDIGLLGFPEAQLRGFGVTFGATSAVDPNETPPAPANPVTRSGDVWIMGGHRLLCGISTDEKHVALAMDGKLAHMVFTDPPYGVAYRDTGSGAWDEKKLARKRAGTLKPRFAAIENDDLSEDQLFEFLSAYMKAQRLAKGAAQYVCHASLRAHVFRQAIVANGYEIRAECIWAKSRPGFNFAHYKHKHEPIYYAVPVKGAASWYGDMTQTTLWEVPSESGAVYNHPTQKPVGLPTIAINNSTKSGQIVYEPFSGSFTTGIACEMTGRRCFAIEIDPVYVDVGVLRWQKFSSREATLAEDGRTFAQVQTERAAKKKGSTGTRRRATRRVRGQSPASSPG